MKKRLLSLPKTESYFLFGARGVGKSTLISDRYKDNVFLVDLLDTSAEAQYLSNPERLKQQVLALPSTTKMIIIDEVQKVPALLSVVHSLIEQKINKQFVLTGSSARKLKHGSADMLAGRAFLRNLYPFSFIELDKQFDLSLTLNYGLLPKVTQLKSHQEKADFLRAYVHIYLKEEVWAEHLIRKLEPFQYFLEVAAQSNGDIINTANIARDVGVNDKTVAEYFSILEDTLIGFHLHSFKGSIRKKLLQKPKFYYFDVGVARALRKHLSLKLEPQSYEYEKVFEHFIILEIHKLVQYFYPDYTLSYIRTSDSLEIDLVVERPGLKTLFIEIKSGSEIKDQSLKHLITLEKNDAANSEYICLSQIKIAEKRGNILLLPWQEGIKKYFTKA
jgi:uncharacterized protein